MQCSPITYPDKEIVVSAGLICEASAMSSTPITEKSRGTDNPNCPASKIMPMAVKIVDGEDRRRALRAFHEPVQRTATPLDSEIAFNHGHAVRGDAIFSQRLKEQIAAGARCPQVQIPGDMRQSAGVPA